MLIVLQNACAEILLPELLRERIHVSQPHIIHRPREVSVRVTCGAYSYSFQHAYYDITFLYKTFVRQHCSHRVGFVQLVVVNFAAFALRTQWQVAPKRRSF
jgi:hypothetical protein